MIPLQRPPQARDLGGTTGQTKMEWEEALLMAWGGEIPPHPAAHYRRQAARARRHPIHRGAGPPAARSSVRRRRESTPALSSGCACRPGRGHPKPPPVLSSRTRGSGCPSSVNRRTRVHADGPSTMANLFTAIANETPATTELDLEGAGWAPGGVGDRDRGQAWRVAAERLREP